MLTLVRPQPCYPPFLSGYQDEAKNPSKRPGHAVAGSAANVNVSPEVKLAQERVQLHQAGCPKLSWAEEVRTIMAQKSGFATISTMSNKHEGFPLGSIVGFAVDSQGRPFFSFSALSSHTQNLLSNPKASLCVTEPKFKGAADARVTLIGSVNLVDGEESDALRKEYMVSHPGAYWAEFGDFKIYRMDKIEDVSFVGGFARAGGVTVEEYMSAEPDPLMAFADPVMNHMNEDHTDSLKEYVTYLVSLLATSSYQISITQTNSNTFRSSQFVGMSPRCLDGVYSLQVGVEGGVDSAQMKRLDKYGFDIRVAKGSDSGILRIPFRKPISCPSLPIIQPPTFPFPFHGRLPISTVNTVCTCIDAHVLMAQLPSSLSSCC